MRGASKSHGRRGASLARRALALAAVLSLSTFGAAQGEGEREGQREGVTAAASEPEAADEAANQDPAAALRAALALEAAGEVDAALGRLAAIAVEHPVIADVADLLRVRALRSGDRMEEIPAVVREAEARTPTSPLRAELARHAGDALDALGEREAARAAWTRAVEATRDAGDGASLREKIAGGLEASGEPRAAAALYREIWERTPTDPAARRANTRLVALEASLGEPLRDGASFDARAERLFAAGWSEEALAATDEALARGLPEPAVYEARRRRAHALFRLRRYDEAASAFGAIAGGDAASSGEARLFRARSLARGGDVGGAVAALKALAEEGGSASAAQARWTAGLLLDGEGQGAEARALFEAVTRQSDDPSLVGPALWRLAWSDFRAGDFAAARERLVRLQREGGDLFVRLQARYWAARAAEEGGDADTGREEHAALAGEWSLSYYGGRARARLGAGAEVVEVHAPPPSGALQLPPHELARPRILVDAGLPELARQEVARLAAGEGASRSTPGPADRLALARLAERAADPASAQSLVLADWSEALQRRPAPGGEEPFRLAYPEAYADLVRRAGGALEHVPRSLIWAIMREESGYRPAVVSSAGARGLMQIMPDTGARLAREVGIEGFDAGDLFDPATNIRLGAHFLDRLGARFPGRLSAAIASYNAGPEPVSRWLAQRGPWPDDAWVEEIPYDQTRNYVKRVLRSLRTYEALYGR